MSKLWKYLADFHYNYLMLRYTWPGDDASWEFSQHVQNFLCKKARIPERGGTK